MTAHGRASDDPLLAELRMHLGDRVQVLGPLGEGGMGTVYRGRDPLLKRDVAIKLLRPEIAADAEARARFIREARAAAGLRDPGVVSVYEVGTLGADGAPFFIMEFVAGATLADQVPAGTPASGRDVRRMIGQVAAALAHAHERGLVHRDIKPSNLLVDDATGRVVLADFGISSVSRPDQPPAAPDDAARAAQRLAVPSKLTTTGMYLGTPLYMSPEQASAGPVGPASDVYSLGCVAFELLAGRPVFQEKTALALMAAHVKDAPPVLRTLRADVEPDLEELIGRMLAKDPAARPSAKAVAAALGDASGLLEWPPPGARAWQGTLMRAFRRAGGSSVLVAITVALLFSDPRYGSGYYAVALAVPGIVLGIGVLALLVAAARAGWAAFTGARFLRGAGYDAGTVLEVLLDADGDWQDLLTGRGARFGGLGRARLRAIRRARIGAAALYAATGVVGGLLGLLAGTLEAGAHGTGLNTSHVALAAFVLLAVAWCCERWTPTRTRLLRFGFRPAPRRLEVPAGAVVQAWRAQRAAGSELGPPPAARAALRMGGAAAALIALTIGLTFAVTAIIGLVGTMGAIASTFRYTDNERYLRALHDDHARLASLDWLLLPVDSSITPAAAAQALVSLGPTYAPRANPAHPWHPGAGWDTVPGWPELDPRDSLFRWVTPAGETLREGNFPNWRRAFLWADGPASPAEVAWLVALAAHPRIEVLRTLGRAPRIAWGDALWRTDPPDDALEREIPYVAHRLRNATQFAILAAAGLLRQGRPASADTVLRLAYGAARRAAHDTPRGIELLFANASLTRVTRALQALYVRTDSSRAARLAAALASDAPPNQADRVRVDGSEALASLAAFNVRDRRLPRALRIAWLDLLWQTRCSSPLRVVRGADPEVRALVDSAAQALAPSGADRAYVRALLEGPERDVRALARGAAEDAGVEVGVGMRLVGPVASLTGVRALQPCLMHTLRVVTF